MTDAELIARLRAWARDIQTGSTAIWAMDQDVKAAADRIETLEAELLAAFWHCYGFGPADARAALTAQEAAE